MLDASLDPQGVASLSVSYWNLYNVLKMHELCRLGKLLGISCFGGLPVQHVQRSCVAPHQSKLFGTSQDPSQLPFGSVLASFESRTSFGGRYTRTRPSTTFASKVATFSPGLLMPFPVSKLYVFLWIGHATLGWSPCKPMRPRESTCSCLWGQEFCEAYHLPTAA